MSLKVEPLEDKEIDEFIRTYYRAFTSPESPGFMPLIYPLGLTPQLLSRLRDSITKALGEGGERKHFIVRDPTSNNIMAVAHWGDDLEPPRTKEEVDAGFLEAKHRALDRPRVDGMNLELRSAIFEACYYSEAEVARGRPHITLKFLAANPEFGRRGAGTLLLTHGLQRADEKDLPVYLDASEMGKPLYERHGFEVKKELPINAMDYGSQSPNTHWCMWRPSRSDREQIS